MLPLLKTGKSRTFCCCQLTHASRDRKQTLKQNYERLGLSSRLEAASGGVEKRGKENEQPKTVDTLATPSSRKTGRLAPEEVQVERDPETGRILRVVSSKSQLEPTENPLSDPLNDLMDVEPASRNAVSSDIIAALEQEAEEEGERLAKKRPRQQSQREEEWIQRLVEKHGDNIRAMVRDRQLNPMQQTEGDIGRRIKKWKKQQAVGRSKLR